MVSQEARPLSEVVQDLAKPVPEPNGENDTRVPTSHSPIKDGVEQERFPWPSYRSKCSSEVGTNDDIASGLGFRVSHRSADTRDRRTASGRWREKAQTRMLRSRATGTLPWEDSDDDDKTDVKKTKSCVGVTGIAVLDAARRCATPVVRHWAFDATFGVAIVLNSICIAVEQAYTLSDIETPALEVLEDVFLAIYVVELGLRFFVGGLAIAQDRLVKFECCIVLVSVITQWFVDTSELGEIRVVAFIRLARLAHLTRTVRLIVFFRELWILVHGMLASTGIMLYTMVLLGVLIFFFALLGVELIAIRQQEFPDPDTDHIVEEYFGSLGSTMLTLVQFVTLDSMSPIYRPLVKRDPFLAVYFISVMLSIGIVLMNLITAVSVHEAFEHAQRNKEAARVHEAKQKKRILKELKAFFIKLDEDASGKVEFAEICEAEEEDMAFIKGYIKETDLQEVFCLLDIDGDGALDINEFCQGLYETTIAHTPLDIKRVDKRLESVRGQVNDMYDMQCSLQATLNAMSLRLDLVSHKWSPFPHLPEDIGPACHADRSVDRCTRLGRGCFRQAADEHGIQQPTQYDTPTQVSPSIHPEATFDLGESTCAQQVNTSESAEDWLDVNAHERVRLAPLGRPPNRLASRLRPQREATPRLSSP